jgi:hypothetical protein
MTLTSLKDETRIQTRRGMVTDEKPEVCKMCKVLFDDKWKKETNQNPDTSKQEAASRANDSEDPCSLESLLPGTAICSLENHQTD